MNNRGREQVDADWREFAIRHGLGGDDSIDGIDNLTPLKRSKLNRHKYQHSPAYFTASPLRSPGLLQISAQPCPPPHPKVLTSRWYHPVVDWPCMLQPSTKALASGSVDHPL